MRPPKIAETLLGWFLPVLERDEILGDMAERYARTVAREGRVFARAWYWRQAVTIPFHILRTRISPVVEMHELRFAARSLRRSPGFTTVAVLTLALGIGANTAIFSIVNGVVLRPLPYAEPDEIVRAFEHNDTFGRLNSAWVNFLDWRDGNGSFDELVSYNGYPQTVIGGDEPIRAGVSAVSLGFLRVFEVEPELGRGFRDDEHVEGATPVAVVSHDFWQDQLGATAALGDIELIVAGHTVTVVGVMPPDFAYPAGIDVWYPLELTPQSDSRTAHNWRVVGRLADGITAEQAQQDLSLITARFAEGFEDDDYMPLRAEVVSLQATMSGTVASPLLLLLGASVLVILVGCTNLASTLLARGSSRGGELAVLRALGAEKGRVIWRLFAESVILAALGAVAGLALAAALIRALPVLLPSELPRMDEIALHPIVAVSTVLVTGFAAILFGLLPAWKVAASDLSAPLRDGGRTVSVGGKRGPWRTLVVAEVAMALVLLAGAGLLMRSLWQASSVDAGFVGDDVMAMTVALPTHKFGGVADRAQYYEELMEQVRALPGVESAGMGLSAPLQSSATTGRISIDAGPEPTVNAGYMVADEGYFQTLQIPVIRGRLFEPTDNADSQHVVVINQAMAELAWPGENPLGKRLTGGGMDEYWDQPDAWATVIGVVGNVRQRDLTEPPEPTFYFTHRQRAFRARAATILAKAGGEASQLTGPMREAARGVDADVPVSFFTVDDFVTQSLGDRRFLAEMLGSFAAMGLLLAALGIYGVVAYTVALRTREVGIRMALGSSPGEVMGMVLRESMMTVGIGLAVGLAGAFAVSRVLTSFLFEVSPMDPVAIGVTAFTLLSVAALASFIPARRAATIDPLITMRSD